jgi:hypothetical protein
LHYFFTRFLLPLYRDGSQPFGALSIALSGPKPDPFIALHPAPSLETHLFLHVSKETPPDQVPIKPGGNETPHGTKKDVDRALTPTRPESGDHIRLYCDARYALSLRSWLYGVEIPISILGSDPHATTGTGKASGRVSDVGSVTIWEACGKTITSGVQPPIADAGPTSSVVGGAGRRKKDASMIKVFDKARLALIGSRGEVLAVV